MTLTKSIEVRTHPLRPRIEPEPSEIELSEPVTVVWQYWRTVEARGSVKSLGVGEVDLGTIG